MSRTFSIKTLGCKLNQYESSEIAGEFTSHGWVMRPFGEEVDVTIINTCTVTDNTDRKCRGFIKQGARHSASGNVIVTGCMTENSSELSKDPSVTLVLGNREKGMVYRSAEKLLGNGIQTESSGIDTGKPLPLNRARASIKIQDGCDNYCSYCIVPSVRGKPQSRNINNIIEHAEKLIDKGYHELVLTGITIGKYRYEGVDFAGLVEKLIGLKGDYRIRITSIEPVDVTGRLIELYGSEKICDHIHLPLQSGSDKILGLMNRKYRSSEYMSLVERMRRLYPEIAIGTDLILGFPGEDETDFASSMNMIQNAGFAYTHCFPFSPRRGTPAALMKENPGPGTSGERVKTAKSTASSAGERYRKEFLNRSLRSVITRNERSDTYTGVTGNYIKVRLEGESVPENFSRGFMNVKILRVDRSGTYGIIER